MGNYRFRLSNMMPNAWFYKLKDLSRASSRNQRIPHPTKRRTPPSPQKKQKPLPPPSSKNQAFLPNRASYYFPRSETEKLPKSAIIPPRKSKRSPKNPSTNLVYSSVSSNCGCRALSSEFLVNEDGNLKKPISVSVSEIQLPPILTKPTKIEAEPIKYYESPSNKKSSFSKKSPTGLHRLRLRASSPRLASKKKLEAFRARRSVGLPASFAVLKHSSDPQSDFRDSMVEMIVENNIRASKDLEELLACYLVLNSNEYHDVIVKVFEQIWFELTEIIRL